MGCGSSLNQRKSFIYNDNKVSNLNSGSYDQVKQFYLFKQLIVEGQLGKVYVVKPQDKDEQLMMTVINQSNIIGYDAFRLQREITVLKEIQSGEKGIVKYVDGFTNGQEYFMITEQVKYRNIVDLLDVKSRFTEKVLAKIVQGIAQVLQRIHESQSYMHRNLRLECILVHPDIQKLELTSEETFVKIIDWSSGVKLEKGQQLTQNFTDTLYSAPEVLRGKYNEKQDVWSLGVIIYMLMSGWSPFESSTQKDLKKELYDSQFKIQFVDLDVVWKESTPQIRALVSQLMDRNPAKRPSMKQVLLDPWFTKGLENPLAWGVPEKVAEQFSQNCHDPSGIKNINNFLLGTGELKRYSTRLAGLAAEVDELKRIFQKIDKDENGQIDRKQFAAGLRGINGLTEGEIQKIIDQIFAVAQQKNNNNEKLNIDEFIDLRLQLGHQNIYQDLHAGLTYLDPNMDNSTTMVELISLMSSNVTNKQNLMKKNTPSTPSRSQTVFEKALDQWMAFDFVMNTDDLTKYDNSPVVQMTFYDIYPEKIPGELFLKLYNLHHGVIILDLKDGRTVQMQVIGMQQDKDLQYNVGFPIRDREHHKQAFHHREYKLRRDDLTVSMVRDYGNQFMTVNEGKYQIRQQNCYHFAYYVLSQFTFCDEFIMEIFRQHLQDQQENLLGSQQLGLKLTGGSSIGGLIGGFTGAFIGGIKERMRTPNRDVEK